MQDGQERRAHGMRRVPVEALVEICGRESGGAPPFEAESVDVSGRGMHVRTAYLPEVGAPLVCRFEDSGREIVVEGEVAWSAPADRGGEFGIKFTALDSGSVDALRDLCAREITRIESEKPPAVKDVVEEPPAIEEPPETHAPGSRVRLHIDGLGAPMKASVREGTSRRLHVASNLEFLKVGRTLQLEGGAGERRPARIHAVDVMVDPSTQVPQLVVSLKFQDVDEVTPEPSVIDSAAPVTPHSPQLPLDTAFEAMDAGEAHTDDDFDMDEPGPEPGEAPAEYADPDEDEIIDEAGRFSTRMSRAATVAGAQAKRAGETAAHLSVAAGRGMGRLFKGASQRLGEYRRARAEGQDRPRRTTAPPPSGTLSANGRSLRRQAEAAQASNAPSSAKAGKAGGGLKSKRTKKIAGAAALALLVTTVSVIAMKKPAAPPGADTDAPAASKTVAAESPAGDVTQVDDQGNPIAPAPAAAPAGPAKLKDAPPVEPGGISADVPLFGPTPMATMEPAPLGPPPELGAPTAAGAQTEEEKEKAAASAAVDETFEDSGKKPRKKAKADPRSVKPWGTGRVRTPTIHRLRLDQPGGAIKGAKNPTGFTVVVPGVKVMESARGIKKRDSRIARVRTRNGSYGAEITFQFRNSVPGYRVRLRKDYVEFLISAPKKSGVSSSKKKR